MTNQTFFATTAAGITVTLPAAPSVGQKVTIHLGVAGTMTIASQNQVLYATNTIGTSENFTTIYTTLPYIWTGTYWTFLA